AASAMMPAMPSQISGRPAKATSTSASTGGRGRARGGVGAAEGVTVVVVNEPPRVLDLSSRRKPGSSLPYYGCSSANGESQPCLQRLSFPRRRESNFSRSSAGQLKLDSRLRGNDEV